MKKLSQREPEREGSLLNFITLNSDKKNIQIISKNSVQYVKGSRGHHTFFLTKPIFFGKYYFQVIGHQPEFFTSFFKYPPAFRVGVSPANYYFQYPLGQENSVAYKSNGILVTNKQQYNFGPPYTSSDIIGVGIEIRKGKEQKQSEENNVRFYKNGQLVGKQIKLRKQDVYVMGASLYNEAEVQVRINKEGIRFLPEDYRPYEEIFINKCN